VLSATIIVSTVLFRITLCLSLSLRESKHRANQRGRYKGTCDQGAQSKTIKSLHVDLSFQFTGVLSEIGREVMRNPFELRAFSAQWIRGQLGTWQGIFLFEHRRAAHRRHVSLTIIGE